LLIISQFLIRLGRIKMLAILLAVSTSCSAISRSEAKQLVLLTPNVIQSQAELGADPVAEFSDFDGDQWVFHVYARNAPPFSSSLIGWYEVDPQTYVVRDWILDDKPIQTDAQLQVFQEQLRIEHCPK
jgi:hypothetical protein